MDVLYETTGKWRKNKVKYMKMKRNGNTENNFGQKRKESKKLEKKCKIKETHTHKISSNKDIWLQN